MAAKISKLFLIILFSFFFVILPELLQSVPTDCRPVPKSVIPTEPRIWNSSCCGHEDCCEGRIQTSRFDATRDVVAIKGYQPFVLERKKISHSNNGRDYFCRSDISKPPDGENTLCVFIRANYASLVY